jgi:hypothetical protein
MAEQLSMLATLDPEPSSSLRIVEFIPIPYPGLQCSHCGAFPAFDPRLRKSGVRLRVVCGDHMQVVPTNQFAPPWLAKLEWHWDTDGSGGWIAVPRFAEAPDERGRWWPAHPRNPRRNR